jgi:hypothetical protein
MKLLLCFAVLTAAAIPQQTPASVPDLRSALGGEAALSSIQRLHIKASFDGTSRGKGETEWYVVLPDRLLEKSQISQMRHPAGVPDAVLTGGFEHAERVHWSETHGFVESTPLPSGVPAPKFWTDELRERSLIAGRFTYTRLLLPILGTASTVSSTGRIPGGIVFQDRDRTTWTLKLDASGLPASLLIEGRVTPQGFSVARPMPTAVVTFSDYRPVAGGLVWPHKFVLLSEGEILETTWINSYEINGKIPKVLAK